MKEEDQDWEISARGGFYEHNKKEDRGYILVEVKNKFKKSRYIELDFECLEKRDNYVTSNNDSVLRVRSISNSTVKKLQKPPLNQQKIEVALGAKAKPGKIRSWYEKKFPETIIDNFGRTYGAITKVALVKGRKKKCLLFEVVYPKPIAKKKKQEPDPTPPIRRIVINFVSDPFNFSNG